MEIEETSGKVLIKAQISGIERKEDLHIVIDEDRLTMSGEVKYFSQDNELLSVAGGTNTKFDKTIRLPAMVKADGAHASYKNGVLELSFIKDEHPAARTIQVDFN